ncbi:beta-lactamase family protein [Bacteriovoracaceae bacterium]|nr:beta-lactamase family protein [Bacteriovoracaceae bacterium]
MKYFFILALHLSMTVPSIAENSKPEDIVKGDQAEKIVDWVFKHPGKYVKTLGMYILKNDDVLVQKFNTDPKNLLPLWSISKTISVILLGILEAQGKVHRDSEVGQHIDFSTYKIPDLKIKKKVTFSHLATMSSGIDWTETYDYSPFNSNVVRMLYFNNDDVTSYILSQPNKYPPGEYFYYSSGDTNLLSDGIGRELIQSQFSRKFPWEFLFDPLKIKATFETDKKGVYLGSSYVFMSIFDLAKIGKLILNKGRYGGKEFFKPEFYQYMVNGLNSSLKVNCNSKNMSYGAGVWLNKVCKRSGKTYLGINREVIMLLGHYGQSVFIIPDKKIIAIRLAEDRSKNFDRREYFQMLLEL